MSAHFHTLLDATIQYLEQIRTQGTRFVSITPETLQALGASPASVRSAAPLPVLAAAAASSSVPRVNFSPVALAPRQTEPPPASSKIISPAIIPAVASLDPSAKAQAMAELRERALSCVKCAHLASSRQNVVFGVGDVNARIMFVGEAPGADEDEQGEPFVGKAGQLLTKIIQAMGLSRETVYIANILKCRPDMPGQSSGNRKPTPEEMQTCIPYLHEQIDLIQPQVLVALGATAVEGLLGKTVGITRLRGQWQTYRDIALMPTFHPSYLLRPENVTQKRNVWEDMLQVMAKISLPISEKQQGYFLKG